VKKSLAFLKDEKEKLVTIKDINPTFYGRRYKENEQEFEQKLKELKIADGLMTIYADMDEAAAKETVAKMLKPGSGIKLESI